MLQSLAEILAYAVRAGCFALSGRYPFGCRIPPGRCPGLICGCPVRGGKGTAQHQNLRFGLVWRQSRPLRETGSIDHRQMTMKNVAVIFDTSLRPETAGVYCRRALERFVEVQHFQPHELDRIPRTGFDLYLNIDDGLRYHLPADCRPCAFWAIDTHLDFDRCREKAPRFDVVFAAQRDGVELLRGIGVQSASWLPLACDPDVHRKHDDVAKQYDVAFVGNVFPGPRGDLLGLIQRRYRSSFVGQCYFDDMARTYSAARIAFNRSIRNDVNMRVFEAVACGSMLMTNDLGENGLGELFRDGVHLATYRGGDDLLDKLAFYLGARSCASGLLTRGGPRRLPSIRMGIGWRRC